MGLKYKLVKNISFQGNSERNLVLRQQFAIEMLKLLDSKKRVLNLDESTINSLTFFRRKWKEHGTTNSIPHKQVAPSNSLIAAIDTEGDIYLSFTQVHTDTITMKLYLAALAKQLDADRPECKKDTVLLLDGARYHKSDEIQSWFQSQGIQVIYTGPHSYDAAPAELFFAQLKTG